MQGANPALVRPLRAAGLADKPLPYTSSESSSRGVRALRPRPPRRVRLALSDPGCLVPDRANRAPQTRPHPDAPRTLQ